MQREGAREAGGGLREAAAASQPPAGHFGFFGMLRSGCSLLQRRGGKGGAELAKQERGERGGGAQKIRRGAHRDSPHLCEPGKAGSGPRLAGEQRGAGCRGCCLAVLGCQRGEESL